MDEVPATCEELPLIGGSSLAQLLVCVAGELLCPLAVLSTPLTRSISCNNPPISTTRRTSVPVVEIIQGKATVAATSRQFELTPAEIDSWVEDGQRGMENALRAKRCAANTPSEPSKRADPQEPSRDHRRHSSYTSPSHQA